MIGESAVWTVNTTKITARRRPHSSFFRLWRFRMTKRGSASLCGRARISTATRISKQKEHSRPPPRIHIIRASMQLLCLCRANEKHSSLRVP